MTDIPVRCSGCRRHLPDGAGNQELQGEEILRFCNACWKKRCEEEPMAPEQPQAPAPPPVTG